jgi:hypothetical protein
MKTLLFTVLAVIAILGGYYLIFGVDSSTVDVDRSEIDETVGGAIPLGGNPDEEIITPEVTVDDSTTVIGRSVNGADITAYHYGTGDTELLFVGGIHGGYEWNTALIAFELMDYLETTPQAIPENVTVTVIPVLNPDGLKLTTGSTGRFSIADIPTTEGATVPGRFNANNVDLNRNFDCDWQPTGVWQNKQVDAGTSAFSEPESSAFKSYIENNVPTAVVVWYSSAGGVFSSNCHSGVLPETKALTTLYSDATGYKAYEEFNFYEITGDMVNWLAKINIPAISVLLTTHTDVEWSKNKPGIDAVLQRYAQ